MSWFDRFFKKEKTNMEPLSNEDFDSIMSETMGISGITTINSGYGTCGMSTAASGIFPSMTIPSVSYPTTGAVPAYTTTIGTAVGGGGGGVATGIGGFGGITFGPSPSPTSIITWSTGSKEIVRMNIDGTITWADGYQIDEAAEAFARAMSLGSEFAAGVTRRVKSDMRDSVFADIIEIAKEKGSLTAEDLTYLLRASKIVEKLKGAKE